MISNLKKAAWDRKNVMIGGGEFGPEELRLAAHMMDCYADMLEALEAVADAYQKHFDVMPVAWQTYDNIVCRAIEKAQQKRIDK